MAVERVVVVGAGTMGSGIAQVFAAHGREVLLVDLKEGLLARGMDAIRRSLARLVRKGEIPEGEAGGIVGRIAPSTRFEDARGAGFAVEAVSEEPGVKREVFRSLD
ncbi:MAG: 3-hydroxyacyl-CoA dehydrogenase NAD-binding domain-containing protein, partial [Planctomycetota bacterium]